MRFLFICLLIAWAVFQTSMAQARDTEYRLKIDEVLRSPDYQQRVGSDVAFYFAGQKAPGTDQTFGEYVTNKKTNSAGKSDQDACRWAMLSALLELRERATKMGGDAVTNIVSYYKKQTVSSETEYVCHAGAIIAGVALKGTVVKLKK